MAVRVLLGNHMTPINREFSEILILASGSKCIYLENNKLAELKLKGCRGAAEAKHTTVDEPRSQLDSDRSTKYMSYFER